MNKGIIAGIAFIAGAALGSVVTWKVVSTKYERIANEEAESFRKRLSELSSGETKKEESQVEEASPETDGGFNEIVEEAGYINYNSEEESKKVDDNAFIIPIGDDKPYVIAPEDFGTLDGTEDYDIETLTYYADKVLTDDFDNLIRDVENTVGRESLTTFGEYEPDSVYVVNHRIKTYFEILADTRKYSSVMSAYSQIEDDE